MHKDSLINNKKVNIDFSVKNEEDIKKQKEKEQALLKQINKKIEEKKKSGKEVITTNKIINLEIDKKGINIDSDILDKIVVIDDKIRIKYDKNAKPITVMSKKEASKLQNRISQKTKEKKQEEIIIKKTDSIINKAYEEINFIVNEITKLESSINKEYSTEKLKDFEKRLIGFQGKIEKLERQYDILLNNVDFINFDELNDEKLLDVIAYYKFIIDTNEQLYDLSVECKKSLDKIEEINILRRKKQNINEMFAYKKKALEMRDEDYYQHQKRVKKLDKISEEVKRNIEKQNEFTKSLINKIEESEERFKDEINLKGLNKIGNRLFLFSLLIYASKYNNYGFLLGTLLLNNGITGMRNNMFNNQIKKTFLEYKELNKQLYSQIGELNYITDMIKDSLSNVEKLKEEFKSRFGEYSDVLPEYNSTYKKINIVIEQLKEKEKQIQEAEKKIEKQYEKNKVKIKKMESA